jgi:hypothetical protein
MQRRRPARSGKYKACLTCSEALLYGGLGDSSLWEARDETAVNLISPNPAFLFCEPQV